ncbi:unnamed protein product [Sphenostylis stenocarpa]|uniref:Uncharacterized protein n=1 Tax=Sphenostylis stenocarpa TaxID=92480 RepID=A0AA86RP15_9FABA|nr:unnamed protein product [Sphenostylis stenocarpa]
MQKLGYNQRHQWYPDGGMWMQNQSQEESHFYNEESWSSENNHHLKKHPAMDRYASDLSMHKQHSMLGGKFQESMHSDYGFGNGYAHYGGGVKLPYGGGGGSRFNSAGQHEYFSEETECESSYGTKMDEMKYQQNNWGAETCYANPYGNMNYRPKVQWAAKGV